MIRPLTLAAIGLLALLSVALFQLKYEVRGLEETLRDLDGQLAADDEAVQVLKAEWSFLNRPDRLQALAVTHLDLEPVVALQVGALYRIPARTQNFAALDSGRLPQRKPQVPPRPASFRR
jgi:hypothetical protein